MPHEANELSLHSDGVMTDEDETVVIKPCTPVEIEFYQHATTHFPELAYFMPQFMGTLQLQKSNDDAQADAPPKDSTPAGKQLSVSDPNAGNLPDPLRLKGKAIDTDICIVLSAVTAGFKKPNVLDLKLGARLWADDAALEKRQRLDKVSAETTSGLLGFRIAGMRVWQGNPGDGQTDKKENSDITYADLDSATNYLIYNKMYGRSLPVNRILEGFESYLLVPQAGIGKKQAFRLLEKYIEEIEQLRDVLSSIETRMYSASILLVYEGDPEAHALAATAEGSRSRPNMSGQNGSSVEVIDGSEDGQEVEDEAEDENDDEEEEQLRSYAIKMIDFAHASSVPGQGPDENVLHGVRSILELLTQFRENLREG